MFVDTFWQAVFSTAATLVMGLVAGGLFCAAQRLRGRRW